MNRYPRESVEFQPITVTLNGVAVTTGVTVQVVVQGNRPVGAWVTPTTLSGVIGVMVSGQAPGSYTVWAKVTSAPETPVINCGTYVVE
jgi:hypothetical protein